VEPQDQNPLEQVVTAGRDEMDVIAGHTVFGEPLCLMDCFVHQMKGAAVQHPQVWTANATLLGVDYPPPQIQGLELRIPSMRGFYGNPLLDAPQEAAAGPRESVTITWQSSPEVAVQLNDTQLVFDDDWELKGSVSDLRLRATPRVRLLSSTPVAATALDHLIGPLMVLIGVCLGRDVDVEETRLLLEDDLQARRLEGWRLVVTPSEELRPWLGIGNLQPYQRTFERWFSLANELPTGLAMLAEFLRAGPATPSEDRLLYLARFVEQYHRARHDSLRMPKTEFRARREQVRDAVGGQLGSWVYDLIAHSNERVLAERIQELVDLHATTLGPTLGPDAESFAQSLADTRNYYTHYSTRLKQKAATGLELIVLTGRLWALVRACLLHELGFPSDKAMEMLSLDPALGWLSRQA
jgi:hypothetical protein